MPEKPEQPQKSLNWKNVLIGVLIGSILVGGGVGLLCYLLFQPKSSEPTVTTPKKATSSAKKATPSAQKDETAGWKTFTSTKFGFKVKYPSEWKIAREIDKGANIFSQEELSGGLFIEVYISDDYNQKEYQKVETISVGQSSKFDAGIPGTNLQDTYTRLEDTTVDGYKAVRYKKEPGFGDADNPKTYNAIIGKSGKLYLLRNKLYEQSFDEGIKLLDKILSTFKFL
jgi:hypothetical protein